MRYFGQKSVVSKLAKVFNALWYVSFLTLALNLYSLLSFLFNPDFLDFASTRISLSRGLTLKIAPEYANPANGRLLVALGIVGFVVTPISMFIIYQLRGLFQAFTRKQLLTLPNAKRIRFIGSATVVFWVISVIADFLGVRYTTNAIAVPGLEVTGTFVPDYWRLFLGLIILVVAEIYKMAAEISEESQLTV